MTTFATARAARDAAKAALNERLGMVRSDLDARSVVGRVADKVVGDAAEFAIEAIEIVETHKVVVAGTLAAIVLWFLRNPIIAGGRRLWDRITKKDRGVWS